jgi:putative transposase
MEPFEEGYYYHIYNRGAGRANLFFEINDYHEFLKKYFYYLYPSVQTYSWCLLSNHFHALIRIRTLTEQTYLYKKLRRQFDAGKFHGKLSPAVKPFIASKQLSHLMNSYTRYVNKREERTGTLIQGPINRIKILDELHFLHMVCYIHRNPIHHKLVQNYTAYPYSSYSDFISGKKSFVEKKNVIERFGGTINFVQAHDEFRLNIEMSSKNGLYLE